MRTIKINYYQFNKAYRELEKYNPNREKLLKRLKYLLKNYECRIDDLTSIEHNIILNYFYRTKKKDKISYSFNNESMFLYDMKNTKGIKTQYFIMDDEYNVESSWDTLRDVKIRVNDLVKYNRDTRWDGSYKDYRILKFTWDNRKYDVDYDMSRAMYVFDREMDECLEDDDEKMQEIKWREIKKDFLYLRK